MLGLIFPLFMGLRLTRMAWNAAGRGITALLAPAWPMPPQPAGAIGMIGIAVGMLVFLVSRIPDMSVAMFVLTPVLVSVAIGIGWCVKGAAKSNASTAALKSMPDIKRPVAANDLRARARELRIRQDLSVSCPLCESPPLTSCRVTPGIMHYMLDEERELYAHSIRLQKAGSARGEELVSK